MNETETHIMKLKQVHIKALEEAERWMFHSDICPYLELRALLSDPTPEARGRFRFLFITYYGLNVGGLTDEFKDKYFEILFRGEFIPNGQPDYAGILNELSKIKRKKGDYMVPFSFVSKLVAIRCESYPIYDRHVLAFFGEKAPSVSDNNTKRIEWFVGFLDRVAMSYNEWAKDERIRSILEKLKARDPRLKDCDVVRLIDFLIWKVGSQKLLTK